MIITFVQYGIFMPFLSQIVNFPVNQRAFMGHFVEKITFRVTRTS